MKKLVLIFCICLSSNVFAFTDIGEFISEAIAELEVSIAKKLQVHSIKLLSIEEEKCACEHPVCRFLEAYEFPRYEVKFNIFEMSSRSRPIEVRCDVIENEKDKKAMFYNCSSQIGKIEDFNLAIKE